MGIYEREWLRFSIFRITVILTWFLVCSATLVNGTFPGPVITGFKVCGDLSTCVLLERELMNEDFFVFREIIFKLT